MSVRVTCPVGFTFDKVILLLLPLLLLLSAQELVSFPTKDGGTIVANIYEGKPETAVVLTHSGRFNKESWDKQARIIASETGFRALALDFRGYGKSIRCLGSRAIPA